MPIANILIGFVVIILTWICSLIYGHGPKTGDAGVGYAFTLLISLGLLVLLVAIIMLLVGYGGGFDWLLKQSEYRLSYLFIGGGLALWGVIFTVIGSGGSEWSKGMKILLVIISFISMIALLLSLITIVNRDRLPVLQSNLYYAPVFTSIGIGLICLIVSGVTRVIYSFESSSTYIDHTQSKNQDRILEEISQTNVMEGWKDLIPYTQDGYSRRIQKKAVAKITSHPDWQNEIINAIGTPMIRELYSFLLQQEVDAYYFISEHLSSGFKVHAELIRQDIRNCHSHHSLYKGRFYNEIVNALSAAEKFKTVDFQYKEEVSLLRSAFNEPTHFEKPNLEAVRILDKWIQKHGK